MIMEIKIGRLSLLLIIHAATAANIYEDSYYQLADGNNYQNVQYSLGQQVNNGGGFGVRIFPGAQQLPSLPSIPGLQLPFIGQFLPQSSTPQVVPPSGRYNDAPLRFDIARLGAAMPVLQPALTRLAYNPDSAGVAGTAPLVQPAIPTRVVYLPDIRTIPPPPPMIRPAFQPPLIRLPEYVPRVPTSIPARPRYPFLPLDRIRTRPATATAYIIRRNNRPHIVAIVPHTSTFPYPQQAPTFQYGQPPPFQFGQAQEAQAQTLANQALSSQALSTQSRGTVRSSDHVHGLYSYVDESDGTQKVVQFSGNPQAGFNRIVHKRG